MKRLPRVSFTNLYGPTEATIASSFYRVPACPTDDKAPISIGAPCDGEDLMVLDDRMRPTAVGETGDLYISGVGLSPGYWKDPEKTAAVFVPHPTKPQERAYKTGDLARIGEDGLIYLIGRADSQIKSRGYRIELGEIESAFHTLGGLQECAVVAIDSKSFDGATICCAYVPQPGSDLSARELRRRVAELLPSYMIPARWISLERMPLNASGKIDRRKLREEFAQREEEAAPAQVRRAAEPVTRD
jgi:acyl-coenzyme A synthetase/AMP-(fatty) acid ligase